MVYTVEREKPAALGLLAKGIKFLFNNPTTPFLTAKARDILFDGVPINCTSKDFATSAICSMIRMNPAGLKPDGDDIFLFSFFGMVRVFFSFLALDYVYCCGTLYIRNCENNFGL